MELTATCDCGRSLSFQSVMSHWNIPHSVVQMEPGRITVALRCEDCGEMAQPLEVDPLLVVDWLLTLAAPSEHRDGFTKLGVVMCPHCSGRFAPSAFGPGVHPDWRAQLENWQRNNVVTYLRFRCPLCSEDWVTWGAGQQECSPDRMASMFLDTVLFVFPATRQVYASPSIEACDSQPPGTGEPPSSQHGLEPLKELDF